MKKARRTEYSIRLAFDWFVLSSYFAATAFDRAVNRDL